MSPASGRVASPSRQDSGEDSPESPSSAAAAPLRQTPNPAGPANAEAEKEQGIIRFTPEEEHTLLSESHALKTQANTLFTASPSPDYPRALSTYTSALSSCPNYLHFEIGVLHSNIAACQIKLEDWKKAVNAATEALDALQNAEMELAAKHDDHATKEEASPVTKEDKKEEDDDEAEEIISPTASKLGAAATAPASNPQDTKKKDIARIRAKALLRRALARRYVGGWSALQGAEEDYKALLNLTSPPTSSSASTTLTTTAATTTTLSAADTALIKRQLRLLPAEIEKAKKKETAEMLGKLKGLGDGLLKPFGLSTDMFKMEKQEGGGYSLNIDQKAGGSKES